MRDSLKRERNIGITVTSNVEFLSYQSSFILLIGRFKLSEEHLNAESDEEAGDNNEKMEEDNYRGKSLDFKFDADVMQDQRILDTDAVIRFGSRPPSDNLNTDDPYATPNCAEEGVQSDNWQFQNANRIKQKIKRIIRRELDSDDMMSEEESTKVTTYRHLCLRHFSVYLCEKLKR